MNEDPFVCPNCGSPRAESDSETPCPHCRTRPASEQGSPTPLGADYDPMPISTEVEPVGAETRAAGAFEVDPTTGPSDDEATLHGPGGTPAPGPGPGKIIRYFGDYELLDVVGRGGMGVVYKARQRTLNRIVALKMVRAGVLADDDDLRRFQNEAEAVALLDHPGIVPVYEVGECEGQKYFSMKFVEGGNLAERMARYVDDPRATATLLAETAEAVHHAHMRGVLHRDLKPANILVDPEGRGHVTDFGLAKRLEDDVELTNTGSVLGTPAYMSPEQANGRRGSITTATDVYSLGAVLYALLTGRSPFGGSSVLETLEAVRNLPPTPPRKCNPRVPADLETICLKCLEKDPRRRYASTHALAGDLENWLLSRPITARRVGAAERTWLWCRRKPAVAALTASVAMALVGGTASVIAVQTRANGQLARKNNDLEAANRELDKQRLRAVAAEGDAVRRADEVQKVSDFQSRMLAQVDPAQAGLQLTADVKARFADALAKSGVPEAERRPQVEAFASHWSRINATDAALALIDDTILKPAINAVDASFKDQPLVDAALRNALGERYEELGLLDSAGPLLERALESRRRLLGDGHPETLASIRDMGILLKQRGKLQEAMPYHLEALDSSRRALGDDHEVTLTAIADMGALLREMGKADDAAPYFREALERRRRTLGDDAPQTLDSIAAMGLLLRSQGKPEGALAYITEALDGRRRVLGDDHEDTVFSLNDMGSLMFDLGRNQEAVKFFREALASRRRRFGEVHPRTLRLFSNLATALHRAGEVAEADALLRESLANDRLLLGPDHPTTLVAINNLAASLIEQGRAAEAEPLCLESLEKHRRFVGPNHPHTLVATNVMGYVFVRQKQPDKAEPYLRETLEISRRINGEDHPDTLLYTHNLGKTLTDQGRPAEGEPYLRTVVEKAVKVLGESHPLATSARRNLGGALMSLKRFPEAIEALTAAEPAARKAVGPESQANLARQLKWLGQSCGEIDQYERAEAALLESHALLAKVRGMTHNDTLACVRAILELYTKWDAARPGKGYDTKASEWKAKLGGS